MESQIISGVFENKRVLYGNFVLRIYLCDISNWFSTQKTQNYLLSIIVEIGRGGFTKWLIFCPHSIAQLKHLLDLFPKMLLKLFYLVRCSINLQSLFENIICPKKITLKMHFISMTDLPWCGQYLKNYLF